MMYGIFTTDDKNNNNSYDDSRIIFGNSKKRIRYRETNV